MPKMTGLNKLTGMVLGKAKSPNKRTSNKKPSIKKTPIKKARQDTKVQQKIFNTPEPGSRSNGVIPLNVSAFRDKLEKIAESVSLRGRWNSLERETAVQLEQQSKQFVNVATESETIQKNFDVVTNQIAIVSNFLMKLDFKFRDLEASAQQAAVRIAAETVKNQITVINHVNKQFSVIDFRLKGLEAKVGLYDRQLDDIHAKTSRLPAEKDAYDEYIGRKQRGLITEKAAGLFGGPSQQGGAAPQQRAGAGASFAAAALSARAAVPAAAVAAAAYSSAAILGKLGENTGPGAKMFSKGTTANDTGNSDVAMGPQSPVNPNAPNVNPKQSKNDSKPFGALKEQREKFREELKDPGLRKTVAAMALSEVGYSSPSSQAAIIETMMNRAAARGTTLRDVVEMKPGGQKANYYAPYFDGAYGKNYRNLNEKNMKEMDSVIDNTLDGSNYSNFATDNSSAGVARSAQRTQTITGKTESGETLSRKDRDEYSGLHGKGVTNRNKKWFAETSAAVEREKANPNNVATTAVKPREAVLPEVTVNQNQPAVSNSSGNRVLENQQKVAATRKGKLKDDLLDKLNYAASQSNVEVEVVSGGQRMKGAPGATGSTRHDHGGAADLKLFRRDENGKKRYLKMTNDEDRQIMRTFMKDTVKAGATGVGAGMGYMGAETMHIGGGKTAQWGGAKWVPGALSEGLKERKGFDLASWKKEQVNQTTNVTEATQEEKDKFKMAKMNSVFGLDKVKRDKPTVKPEPPKITKSNVLNDEKSKFKPNIPSIRQGPVLPPKPKTKMVESAKSRTLSPVVDPKMHPRGTKKVNANAKQEKTKILSGAEADKAARGGAYAGGGIKSKKVEEPKMRSKGTGPAEGKKEISSASGPSKTTGNEPYGEQTSSYDNSADSIPPGPSDSGYGDYVHCLI